VTAPHAAMPPAINDPSVVDMDGRASRSIVSPPASVLDARLSWSFRVIAPSSVQILEDAARPYVREDADGSTRSHLTFLTRLEGLLLILEPFPAPILGLPGQ